MHLDRGYKEIDLQNLSLPDKWILSRLQKATADVTAALDSYRFNEAAGAIYSFVWHEFCDWYLEAIKPALYDKERQETSEATRAVLWRVLRDTLVLLHPFIPFVTEEIWHHMPGTDDSIMVATPHPADVFESFQSQGAEAEMALLMEVITGIRNVRGEMNIAPSLALQVQVQSEDNHTRQIITDHQDLIINLARLNSLASEDIGQRPKSSATAVIKSASIFVSLEGIIDFAKEANRLDKAIKKLAAELTTVAKKLGNEKFLSNAPADVIEKVRQKQDALLIKQRKIQANLDKIKEVEG
jgi:valyl-tRNA synthetase